MKCSPMPQSKEKSPYFYIISLENKEYASTQATRAFRCLSISIIPHTYFPHPPTRSGINKEMENVL